MTSWAFMFDDVPEPVWKASTGNCSSCLPSATSSPARAIRSAISGSSTPSSALIRAAAALIRPSQWTTSSWTGSPETGKFSTAFAVSVPQSCCFPSCTAIRLSPVVDCAHYTLAEERRQLPRQPDRVVVGHEKAGARKDAQLGVGEARERLLGDGERVETVLVGPEEQGGHVHRAVGVQELGLAVERPAPGSPGPRPREVGVASHVGEGVAYEVARRRVAARRERC